jgi:hypothetical protein
MSTSAILGIVGGVVAVLATIIGAAWVLKGEIAEGTRVGSVNAANLDSLKQSAEKGFESISSSLTRIEARLEKSDDRLREIEIKFGGKDSPKSP